MYPKIYLAIDNCFASKRWTTPEAWSRVISELGVFYVEASADTELDPLYMGMDYLQDWPKDVMQAQQRFGVKVRNLYSGHGTYSTLGLTHTDSRVRRNMIDHWFKPLIDTAARLDAGLGFYAHCFAQEILQSETAYHDYVQILIDGLSELNTYAKERGCKYLALEQMYSPNQIPWTMDGTAQILRQVTKQTGMPFYFTEDVGHHHQKFIRPTVESVAQDIQNRTAAPWLGMADVYEVYDAAVLRNDSSIETCKKIVDLADQSPWLFASQADSDCYQWLERMGCYSPIVHLQQTDGLASGHKPFTQANNHWGKIRGKAVLEALKKAYDQPEDDTMPKRCEEIYLTLELFSGTAQSQREILRDYQETVNYWRTWIPQDGLTLDQLL